MQALVGYVAICGTIALKNNKKPTIIQYFTMCAIDSFSIALSLTYATVYFFPTASPEFSAITIGCGRILFELMINGQREFYDQDKYEPGFGVEQRNGGMRLQQGLTYFESLRKQHV